MEVRGPQGTSLPHQEMKPLDLLQTKRGKQTNKQKGGQTEQINNSKMVFRSSVQKRMLL